MYTGFMLSKEKDVSVKISLTTIFWVFGIIAAAYLMFRVQEILIAILFAVIVMSAFRPSLKWMERRLRIPKVLAVLILYALFLTFLSLALALIIPPLIRELPHVVQTLSLPPMFNGWSFSNWDTLNLSLSDLGSLLPQIGISFNAIYRVVSSTFSGIFTFFTVLVMSVYMMLDRDNLHNKVQWFTKDKRHISLAKELLDQVERQLGGWVRGQVALMIVIGVITYIGLRLLSVPYALPLAILAGALEILPNLGPTIAAIPAVIIAYLVLGPAMSLFVVLFYVLVQQFENNLIVPKIMKDNVDVNPLTSIILILAGVEFGGVIGALLSIPIYIVIRSTYSMWFRERNRASA